MGNKLEYKLKKELETFINEPEVAYAVSSDSYNRVFEDIFTDKLLTISAIRLGIPYSLFETIMAYCPFSESKWADFLGISTKSLQRYKVSEGFHFKPSHSEKILEILEVIFAGVEVFGSHQKLKLWLKTPNFALGSKKPEELLSDSYGKELILIELHHINHGIFV